MSGTTIVGNAGEYLVVSQLSALGFHAEVTRNTPNVDVFARDDEMNPGRVLWAQVKTGPSYLKFDKDGKLIYHGRPDDLRSYKGSREPVLLCIADLQNSICYWQQVDRATVTGDAGGWRLVIPPSQTLTAPNAKTALRSLMGLTWNGLDDGAIAEALNPWKHVDDWPDAVQVWSRAARVVGEPRTRDETYTTSNGNVHTKPVAVRFELADDVAPRFSHEVENPSFRVQRDDQLFLIYAGTDPKVLHPIATINGDTDEYPDMRLGPIMPAFRIPVSKIAIAAVTILAVYAVCVMLFASTNPRLMLSAVVSFAATVIIGWRANAPVRSFRRRLEHRVYEHARAIRASRPVGGWRSRQ